MYSDGPITDEQRQKLVQTCEIIKFPVPDASGELNEYWVMDGEEEVCMMVNLQNARNIARLLYQDWPAHVFTVRDYNNDILFTTAREVN